MGHHRFVPKYDRGAWEKKKIKNRDVTKLKKCENFQIYFLYFRLSLFQPENVGKINQDQKLEKSKF